jgi:hypothetical protein
MKSSIIFWESHKTIQNHKYSRGIAMKKFSEFLAESVRNYEYNVKLAFKPDNEMMTAIENALQKYNIVSITAPRSLPIQRVDKDFPGLKTPETYIFKVVVSYPAPAEFIRHTIASVGFEFEQVRVLTGEPNSIYFPAGVPSNMDSMNTENDAVTANTSDTPLLQKGYDPQNNEEISGENYGDGYNERLVKNSIGSTDQVIPREFKKINGKTLNDKEFEIGKKSAVGSTINKRPPVRSFAR